MKTRFECPDCGNKFYIDVQVKVNEQRPQNTVKKKCYYIHEPNGWITGCGKRIAYASGMKVCPYCTKPIICMGK